MENVVNVRTLQNIETEAGGYQRGQIVALPRSQAEGLIALRTSPFGGGSVQANYRYSEHPVAEICQEA
jgi:hypothetical protein